MPVAVKHPSKPGHEITVDAWQSDEEVHISCVCGWKETITKGEGWVMSDFGNELAQAELLVRDHLEAWHDRRLQASGPTIPGY